MSTSAESRYQPSRTLSRRLLPLPGETRREYLRKVQVLKRAFREFNDDAANLVRWLMATRPANRQRAKGEWELPPDPMSAWVALVRPLMRPGWEALKGESLDDRRFAAFEIMLGDEHVDGLDSSDFDAMLTADLCALGKRSGETPSGPKLFERLRQMSAGHRRVLLKAVAEWIVGRYFIVRERVQENHKHWRDERDEWEAANPELTPEMRQVFTQLFRGLGLQEKRPRMCDWPRLAEWRHDCLHAGVETDKKRHHPLCRTYIEFCQADPKGEGRKTFRTLLHGKPPNPEKAFAGSPGYLDLRRENEALIRSRMASKPGPKPPPRFAGQQRQEQDRAVYQESHREAMRSLQCRNRQEREMFEATWPLYLAAMKLTEATIFRDNAGYLPHCPHLGADCQFNPHTELCGRYRDALLQLPEAVRSLEPLYREWRQRYLAVPRPPSFILPSWRSAPLPKILGHGFYEVDLQRSRVRLRVERVGEADQWLDFAITPWPTGYSPSAAEVAITSAHLHFVGTRPRLGFRFDVPQITSRLTVSQDQLDHLRSHVYPRPSQDQEFLEAARKLIQLSLPPGFSPLRILAVDLGSGMSAAAWFEGSEARGSQLLPVIKDLQKLTRERRPKPTKGEVDGREVRGLTDRHVSRHLEALVPRIEKVAGHRIERGREGRLLRGDLREETAHVRWMIRDWVRLNTQQILKLAREVRADVIVFESKRGNRVPGRHQLDDAQKKRIAFFPYGQIRRKVSEKAVEHGMRVMTVPYFLSSQFCSVCGLRRPEKGKWAANKEKGVFICEQAGCYHSGDSDENAARVLGQVFWGVLRLPDDPHWHPKLAREQGTAKPPHRAPK